MAKKQPKVQIKYRKISELEKLGGNPRYILEDDMAILKQSINDNPDYFECRPIVLSDRTGSLVIIDGNQRMEAAKLLGLDEVPTVLLHGLSENREKEIIIRANVTNGKWDWGVLGNGNWGTAKELGNWGVDVSFMGGHEDDNIDIDNFFEEASQGKEEKKEDIVFSIHIPADEEDIKDEVKEAVKAVLENYPNVSIK